VTTRSKAVVCGRSLARIASSNPAGDMDVRLLCSLFSGRYLCDVPIPRRKKFYRMRASVYDREALMMRRFWPTTARCAMAKKLF